MTALRFRVQVQPRARRPRVGGRYGDALRVHVQAPPVDGAANQAVVAALAAALAVPRGAVRVAGGSSSRSKWIEVSGVDLQACRRRLAELADSVDIASAGG